MADNTVADLPKKNAVPAEAPKSLEATVQQVLTKAVTHPSDPKSDFAQGVSHITGDPHQKSAGTADTSNITSLKRENTTADSNAKDEKGAESLKASADKVKDKEHPIVKEAEEKKEDEKEKEAVKEGEMPAALKKAIDAKKRQRRRKRV